MTAGTLVIAKWGESGASRALVRVCAVQGDFLRVEKWRPAVRYGYPPRDWSAPKRIPARDVERLATGEDLRDFEYSEVIS